MASFLLGSSAEGTKEVKNKKMPKDKKVSRQDSLDITKEEWTQVKESMKHIQIPIGMLKSRIDNLEVQIKALEEEIKTKFDRFFQTPKAVEPAPPTAIPASEKKHYPIPFEYRQIVDTILNSKFGIDIDYDEVEIGRFRFTIIVPKEYSSLTPEEEKMLGGVDLRPKAIPIPEGANGVRDWANRVFGSFNQEVKAKIVADRTQLV